MWLTEVQALDHCGTNFFWRMLTGRLIGGG
jgi:hypothetical protein